MNAPPTSGPLISLELRWFFAGALPDAVSQWFRNSLQGRISDVDDRDDIYLYQPRHEDFGVKLRQTQPGSPYSLEIKWRQSSKPYQGAHGVAGSVERWLKLGWKDPAGPGPTAVADFAFPAGPWVTVAKRRWQRKYNWDSGTLQPVDPKSNVDSGAVIEIVELELGGWPYSSLLIETYAADEPGQERILDAAIAQLMADLPEPRPAAGDSHGYPSWLASAEGDPLGAARREERMNALLAIEFESMSAQFISNEELGEKRVTVFMTLTAGLGAAAVLALEKSAGKAPVEYAALFIAVGLVWLAFGHLTFLRIVRRNVKTDEFKASLRAMRTWLVHRGDTAARAVLPYDPYGKPDRLHEGLALRRGSGGYAEFVALINSVIVGALGWQLTQYVISVMPALAAAARNWAAIAVAAIAGWVAWKLQDRLARNIYQHRAGAGGRGGVAGPRS